MYHEKEPKLTGRVVFPSDPQYNEDRREFNTFFNRFPFVIVSAQETRDIANAIRWARYMNIPIRLRSGRHNYEGLSVLDNGMVIDVSDMIGIDIDPKCGTAIVQTGLRDFELYEALGSEGLVVPGGLCPTTGVAGLTLGGGQSALSRAWGLTIDSLTGLEMVDANGQILCADANNNSDLFWASCGGGGGNFGVCTMFNFKTRHLEAVAYVKIDWELKYLATVLSIWQLYTVPGSDERLTPLLTITSGEQSFITMQGVFLGPVEKLRILLEPLLHAGLPEDVFIEEIPWLDAVARIADTQPSEPLPFKSVGPFLYDLLPDEGIDAIRRFVSEPPTSSVTVFLHGLGGAVAKVPNQATAYFYRKALSNISYFATWDKEEEADSGIRWVDDFRRAMLPFTRGVYVNTPDLSIRNWPEAYYGTNFKRLTLVKAKYDPENVFNYPQSIPPAERDN